METMSVVFTLTRTYFQFIDDDGNFKFSEPQRASCNRYGNILGDFYNPSLVDDPGYNLYSSHVNTPVEMLAEAAIKLGCTKARIFPNKIITHRGSPVDRGDHLDFYKCYFYFEYESTSQIISQYFESYLLTN